MDRACISVMIKLAANHKNKGDVICVRDLWFLIFLESAPKSFRASPHATFPGSFILRLRSCYLRIQMVETVSHPRWHAPSQTRVIYSLLLPHVVVPPCARFRSSLDNSGLDSAFASLKFHKFDVTPKSTFPFCLALNSSAQVNFAMHNSFEGSFLERGGGNYTGDLNETFVLGVFSDHQFPFFSSHLCRKDRLTRRLRDTAETELRDLKHHPRH